MGGAAAARSGPEKYGWLARLGANTVISTKSNVTTVDATSTVDSTHVHFWGDDWISLFMIKIMEILPNIQKTPVKPVDFPQHATPEAHTSIDSIDKVT